MLRLVQGDVGSGKTVVAALAAARAAEAGFQTAVMAPTELLAEQHGRNFARWLAPLGIVPMALLTGSAAPRARDASARRSRVGRGAGSSIGTHALFQEGVRVPAARRS